MESTSQLEAFPTLPSVTERERELQRPAGSHKKHLPFFLCKPSTYRGWQVFWPGDTHGQLNVYAAGASSKSPVYSGAIFCSDFFPHSCFIQTLDASAQEGQFAAKQGQLDACFLFFFLNSDTVLFFSHDGLQSQPCVVYVLEMGCRLSNRVN